MGVPGSEFCTLETVKGGVWKLSPGRVPCCYSKPPANSLPATLTGTLVQTVPGGYPGQMHICVPDSQKVSRPEFPSSSLPPVLLPAVHRTGWRTQALDPARQSSGRMSMLRAEMDVGCGLQRLDAQCDSCVAQSSHLEEVGHLLFTLATLCSSPHT